jgi:hypothetical protein
VADAYATKTNAGLSKYTAEYPSHPRQSSARAHVDPAYRLAGSGWLAQPIPVHLCKLSRKVSR